VAQCGGDGAVARSSGQRLLVVTRDRPRDPATSRQCHCDDAGRDRNGALSHLASSMVGHPSYGPRMK
jgi:hypothetical protein